jgi:hypothetical protein
VVQVLSTPPAWVRALWHAVDVGLAMEAQHFCSAAQPVPVAVCVAVCVAVEVTVVVVVAAPPQ